ncbi:MAG: hypothetical protein J6S99_04215 [Bacteroidales bacterium]|nr:hypothetical protein [Bacteroidales bacterium]
MKATRATLITLLVFFLWIGSSHTLAQDVRQYYPDNSHTVFVPKKTVLNALMSDYEVERILEARKTDEKSDRYVGNSGLLKKTRVSENSDIPVIGFIKSEPDLYEYDYYIVEYNGQVCFLSKESCPDNSLIDAKNNDIRNQYQSLKDNIENLTREFFNSVSAKAEKASNELSVLTEKEKSLKDSIIAVMTAQKKEEITSKYNDWVGENDARKKASKYLTISRSSLSSPNTASGCDYTMVFTNTSSKDIKYLDWKGNAYNAVDDIVSCTIRQRSLIEGRVTGPVPPNMEKTCTWETIIYNWSAKSLRIIGITITYMDGTQVSLTGKEVSSVVGAPRNNLTYEERQSIEKKAQREVEEQIQALKDVSMYLTVPEYARSSKSDILAPERELYKQIVGLALEFNGLCKRHDLAEWVMPKKVEQLVGTYIKAGL